MKRHATKNKFSKVRGGSEEADQDLSEKQPWSAEKRASDMGDTGEWWRKKRL